MKMDEAGWWSNKPLEEIIYEYAVVRGDLTEQYARDQLAQIINERLDVAERRAREAEKRAAEAGDGFARIVKDYAACAERNVELARLLTAAEVERDNARISANDWQDKWTNDLFDFTDLQEKMAERDKSIRHTLEYAATALEGSSDNGDRYAAHQIRKHLALTSCGDWPAPCNCDDPETHDGRTRGDGI